jgi:hypothetical protein
MIEILIERFVRLGELCWRSTKRRPDTRKKLIIF